MRRSSILGVVALAAIALAYATSDAVGRLRAERALRGGARGRGRHSADRQWAEETCDLVRVNGHYYAAKGPAHGLLDGALVPPAPHAPRGAAEQEHRPRLPGRDGRRAAARDLADGALGGRATCPRPAAARAADGRADRARARDGGRCDPRPRDARDAVLDAPVRARARRGARLSLVLPALRRSLATAAWSRPVQRRAWRSPSTSRSRCRRSCSGSTPPGTRHACGGSSRSGWAE